MLINTKGIWHNSYLIIFGDARNISGRIDYWLSGCVDGFKGCCTNISGDCDIISKFTYDLDEIQLLIKKHNIAKIYFINNSHNKKILITINLKHTNVGHSRLLEIRKYTIEELDEILKQLLMSTKLYYPSVN